jgi:hypothetical protein
VSKTAYIAEEARTFEMTDLDRRQDLLPIRCRRIQVCREKWRAGSYLQQQRVSRCRSRGINGRSTGLVAVDYRLDTAYDDCPYEEIGSYRVSRLVPLKPRPASTK